MSSKQQKMIQALGVDVNRACIDSSAGESVCPVDAFPEYGKFSTSKNGAKYRAAGGQILETVGEKRPIPTTVSGLRTCMTFQATTGVKKPLAAASRITAKGNRIVFDDADCESYIENRAAGARVPLIIDNGIYMMEIKVESPVPFARPAKK